MHSGPLEVGDGLADLDELLLVVDDAYSNVCAALPPLAHTALLYCLLLVFLKDALDCDHDLLNAEAVIEQVEFEATWFFADNLRLLDPASYVVLAQCADVAVSVVGIQAFGLLLDSQL